MNKIKIVPPDDIDIEEFIKSIGFVSSDIQSVEMKEDGIEIEISDNSCAVEMRKRLVEIMKKYTIPNKIRETYYEKYKLTRK